MKSFDDELKKIQILCSSKSFNHEISKVFTLFSNKPLVLYGAGTIGISIARVFKYYNIKVNCFCDKNKTGIQKETGLPIISLQALTNEYLDANIIVCSVNYYDEIMHDLSTLGINPKQIFSKKSLNFPEMTYSDMAPHIGGYKCAFNLLDDDKSKQILLERVKYYLTISSNTVAGITSEPEEQQYFDPEILTLSDGEIFVDGGMYTGDTANIFFQRINNQYQHYYGFEPDERNFLEASKNLYNKPRTTLIQKGLWSKETLLGFSGSLTSSSKLNNEGENSVVVTALDIFFRDKVPPTFIKMDIEGAELEALKGAKHLIYKYKPKLAICAYHKPEDIYILPKFIKNCRNDYKFYLRHYTDSIYETVLYAI